MQQHVSIQKGGANRVCNNDSIKVVVYLLKSWMPIYSPFYAQTANHLSLFLPQATHLWVFFCLSVTILKNLDQQVLSFIIPEERKNLRKIWDIT